MNNEFIYNMIRRKLGLRKHQTFQFANQLNDNTFYYFTRNRLRKCKVIDGCVAYERDSGVSLNFLMSNNCRVKKCGCAGVHKRPKKKP